MPRVADAPRLGILVTVTLSSITVRGAISRLPATRRFHAPSNRRIRERSSPSRWSAGCITITAARRRLRPSQRPLPRPLPAPKGKSPRSPHDSRRFNRRCRFPAPNSHLKGPHFRRHPRPVSPSHLPIRHFREGQPVRHFREGHWQLYAFPPSSKGSRVKESAFGDSSLRLA